MEEARLIYLGVSHHTDTAEGSNLVIDIGGGSTELIVGEGHEPRHLESLAIGCVGLSQQHFGDGKLSQKRFDRARLATRLELRPVAAIFRRLGWSRAIGSSGTVRRRARRRTGARTPGKQRHPTGTGSHHRRNDQGQTNRGARVAGARRGSRPVFPGGVAIFAEVMSTLRIEHVEISGGALREGLLYDMLGRLHQEDTRERAIRAMQKRYHVDVEQAERVEATAAALLGTCSAPGNSAKQRYRNCSCGQSVARGWPRYRSLALPPARRLSPRQRRSPRIRAARAKAARGARCLAQSQDRGSVPHGSTGHVACADVQARRVAALGRAAESNA